jgi:hypothetical protein
MLLPAALQLAVSAIVRIQSYSTPPRPLSSASRQKRPHAAPQARTWCPVQRLAVTTALPHVLVMRKVTWTVYCNNTNDLNRVFIIIFAI